MTDLTTGADFQPTTVQFIDDPYAFYARLPGSLIKDGPLQWLASGHNEVATLLRHPGLVGDWPIEFQQLRVGNGPTSEFITDIILHKEGKEHAALRRLMLGLLHHMDEAQIASACSAIIHEQLDAAFATGTVDLVPLLAIELPVRITCRMFDIPVDDAATIAEYGMTALNSFTAVMPVTERHATDTAIIKLRDYLHRIVADPVQPLSAVVAQWSEHAPMLQRETIVHNLVFLLVSGFTTTVHLISSILGQLAIRPDLWQQLREQPEMIVGAVEEFARHSSPIQHISRMATQRIEMGDALIRPGRVVHLLLGAANRDPHVFDRPNELNLAREHNPHLAFGRGLHACLGAQLGRIEAVTMLAGLRDRVKHIESAVPPIRTSRQVFRGYASVPVKLVPTG